MAASEWTRSVRAVSDTPLGDYSMPGDNTTCHVGNLLPIAVLPFFLALSVSYIKRTLRRSAKLWQYIEMGSLGTSAKWKSVWKPYANLTDTPVAYTSACKYFQMLPGPPGALQSALRLCKSILRCSWKHLQLWSCIQETTRFDLVYHIWLCYSHKIHYLIIWPALFKYLYVYTYSQSGHRW